MGIKFLLFYLLILKEEFVFCMIWVLNGYCLGKGKKVVLLKLFELFVKFIMVFYVEE